MKHLFPFAFFLACLFTLLLLSGCSANDIEVGALKADIGALQKDVSLLVQQNQELTESLEAMRQQFDTYNNIVLDSITQPESAQVDQPPQETDTAPSPSMDMLEAAEQSFSPQAEITTNSEPSQAPLPVYAQPNPEPTPSQEPAPTPSQVYEQIYQPTGAPTTATTPDGHTVYITATGSKYHFDPNCNSGTYYESTMEEALSLGLTPCQKCAGG